jgi:hypothetical protein
MSSTIPPSIKQEDGTAPGEFFDQIRQVCLNHPAYWELYIPLPGSQASKGATKE